MCQILNYLVAIVITVTQTIIIIIQNNDMMKRIHFLSSLFSLDGELLSTLFKLFVLLEGVKQKQQQSMIPLSVTHASTQQSSSIQSPSHEQQPSHSISDIMNVKFVI